MMHVKWIIWLGLVLLCRCVNSLPFARVSVNDIPVVSEESFISNAISGRHLDDRIKRADSKDIMNSVAYSGRKVDPNPTGHDDKIDGTLAEVPMKNKTSGRKNNGTNKNDKKDAIATRKDEYVSNLKLSNGIDNEKLNKKTNRISARKDIVVVQNVHSVINAADFDEQSEPTKKPKKNPTKKECGNNFKKEGANKFTDQHFPSYPQKNGKGSHFSNQHSPSPQGKGSGSHFPDQHSPSFTQGKGSGSHFPNQHSPSSPQGKGSGSHFPDQHSPSFPQGKGSGSHFPNQHSPSFPQGKGSGSHFPNQHSPPFPQEKGSGNNIQIHHFDNIPDFNYNLGDPLVPNYIPVSRESYYSDYVNLRK